MPDLNVSTPASTSSGNGYTFGCRFSLSAAREAHSIKWWRSGSSPYPVRLSIRDDTTGLVIFTTVPDPPVWIDDGGGWWKHSITAQLNAAVPLPAGHSFRVSYYLETAGSIQAYNANGAPTPDAPATWIGNSYDSGDTTYPNQAASGNLAYGVDLTFEVDGAYVPTQPVGAPGDPPTNENLTARIAEWESSDPIINVHQGDGIPWQHLVIVKAMQIVLDASKGVADATLATLDAVFGSGGSLVTGTMRVAIDATVAAVQAMIDASNATISGLVETRSDAIDAHISLIERGGGLNPDKVPIPGGGWVLIEETNFTGTFAWAMPADRYVYHVSGFGAARVIDYRDGVQMLWFRGWAAPLNGDLVGRHQTLNAMFGEIYETGASWPGIIFSAPPDVQVALQAWRFEPG